MKFYFVRHGESETNVHGIFSNRGYQHPLTKKGIQQAQELVRQLAGASINRIYTSPIMRAVQTAEIL